MKRILGLALGALLLLAARVATAQIYYLMPGDLSCASTNAAVCTLGFMQVDPSFNGVTVNGRSRWPFIRHWGVSDAYQDGVSFDDSINYDKGVMFVIHPEFVSTSDTTTYPNVRITQRKVYFSIEDNASSYQEQYVCFKFRYRWITDGASLNEGANFRVPTNWRNDACVNIAGKPKREMLVWTNNEVIQIRDTSNNPCQPGGARCPRGTLIGQIYRIQTTNVCIGSGGPLPCCDSAGSGAACCDGPSTSATSCVQGNLVFRIWGAKIVVEGKL
jgi:hypothetical protein